MHRRSDSRAVRIVGIRTRKIPTPSSSACPGTATPPRHRLASRCNRRGVGYRSPPGSVWDPSTEPARSMADSRLRRSACHSSRRSIRTDNRADSIHRKDCHSACTRPGRGAFVSVRTSSRPKMRNRSSAGRRTPTARSAIVPSAGVFVNPSRWKLLPGNFRLHLGRSDRGGRIPLTECHKKSKSFDRVAKHPHSPHDPTREGFAIRRPDLITPIVRFVTACQTTHTSEPVKRDVLRLRFHRLRFA